MDFKQEIAKALQANLGIDVSALVEVPPKPELGDFAVPCFTLAKEKKQAPPLIAATLAKELTIPNIIIKATGPYVNFFVDASILSDSVIQDIFTKKEKYGITKGDNKTVLIESPGPNTNKPLHLGHLRNMLLGDSIYRMQKAIGKDAHIVNVINDRGVHICKSMLAYQKLGNGETPESTGKKPDHFVGDYYVRYAEYAKENPDAEKEIQEMLVAWENNDPEVRKLWQTMNDWVYDGWKDTFKKLEFSIEKDYHESDTYLLGKEIIEQGLSNNIFQKDEKGAIVIDLTKEGYDTKVLLRADGTSVYITQDVGMADLRTKDYNFDEVIYVVGNEQEYHFNVLFEVFKKLDWKFADKCAHFSYGMVELPTGKMKSREGTVIDTDDILDSLYETTLEDLKEKYSEMPEAEFVQIAEQVSRAAVRFFFLKHDPRKNFTFDPKKSLAFDGETGPYVQYTHARICSILRKTDFNTDVPKFDASLLSDQLEKELVSILKEYPEVVLKAAQLKPNLICHYLLKLSQTFNKYYAQNKVIQEDVNLQKARLALLCAIKQVICNGLDLLHITAPERM